MSETQSESIDKIVPALLKAQEKIHHATKDSKNPHFNSKFASLESVIDATKGPLGEQGIVVIQQPQNSWLVTTLAHTSGQWFKSYTALLLDKQTAQSQGSSISYARRYALAAMTNITQVDDDGHLASNKPQAPQTALQAVLTNPPPKPLAPRQQGKDGDYVCTFGMFKDKSVKRIIDEFGKPKLVDYLHYLSKPSKTKAAPTKEATDFMQNAFRYLDKVEDLTPRNDSVDDITPPEWVTEEIPF